MKMRIALLSLALGWSLPASAQYGYTPPVPPTPPTPPTAPQSTYPTYPSSSPASTGVSADVYSTPAYGSPTYGSYSPQPVPSGPGAIAPAANFDILSYGYLEGFYRYTDFKDSKLDGASGLGVALSAQLFKPVFLKAGFNWGSSNGGSKEKGGYDFSSVSIGAGAYIPISNRFHLMCEVGGAYYKLDADKDSLGFSEGAIYVHPGIRVAATQQLELQGGLTFTSADNYDTMLFNVDAYWKVFSALDLKVGADFGDESTAWKAGLRVRW